MSKEKIIISDPGDEVEPIIIKAELIYVAVVMILMSLLIYGGSFIHPRSKNKNTFEPFPIPPYENKIKF